MRGLPELLQWAQGEVQPALGACRHPREAQWTARSDGVLLRVWCERCRWIVLRDATLPPEGAWLQGGSDDA